VSTHDKTNVILAHGAWADGSSWSAVIPRLQKRGFNVLAAPLPLTSLGDDIAALERAIERTEGPVILAAHAYAGAAISSWHSSRLKALVFVAALAPEEGQTVAEVFYREAPHPKAPQLAPDKHGFIWMPNGAFAEVFAQNASTEVAGILAATQRPIAVSCIQEAVKAPAWRSTSSWYLVAEDDRMIDQKTQRFMAGRMRAKTQSHAVDHIPLVTAPELVAAIILDAVEATILSSV
jgi:pimeloyl-ACP methyl ester carboxylesterase